VHVLVTLALCDRPPATQGEQLAQGRLDLLGIADDARRSAELYEFAPLAPLRAALLGAEARFEGVHVAGQLEEWLQAQGVSRGPPPAAAVEQRACEHRVRAQALHAPHVPLPPPLAEGLHQRRAELRFAAGSADQRLQAVPAAPCEHERARERRGPEREQGKAAQRSALVLE